MAVDTLTEQRLREIVRQELESHQLALKDLPMNALMRKLENDWSPDAKAMLMQGSITAEQFGIDQLIPRVTALPTQNLKNGQMVAYVADAAKGILWPLKYNQQSASTFKWEAVGPTPLGYFKSGLVTDAIASATYANLPTTGAAATLTNPLAGDYLVRLTARADTTADGQIVWLAVKRGGAAAVDDDGISWRSTNWQSDGREMYFTGLVAATALLLQAKSTAVSGRVFEIGFTLTPIRVI